MTRRLDWTARTPGSSTSGTWAIDGRNGVTIADRDEAARHAHDRHNAHTTSDGPTHIEVYDPVNRRIVWRGTLTAADLALPAPQPPTRAPFEVVGALLIDTNA